MEQVTLVLLWVSVAAWAFFLVQGLLNACLIPDLNRISAELPDEPPLVSYVVPARNEETGIARAVESFCTQNCPNVEVVVVNDRSTDCTSQILSELQAKHSRLVVLEGAEPPEGWLGKPNALERGRRHAKGEWILMADADSVHAPDVLRRALAYSLSRQAEMVVVRPKHVTEGFLEAVLMSGVNFFFFLVFPLFLVSRTRRPLLATGSPVFNLIRKDALEACGGFACLRQSIVDDLEIGYHVKKAGFRLAVAFAGDRIGHRMYPGAAAIVQGFAKTTFPTIRRWPWLLPLHAAAALTISVLPYVALVSGLWRGQVALPALVALGLMHVVMAGFVRRYQEPWFVAWLSPVRELGWLWIFLRSFVLFHRRGLEWRGRRYGTATASSS